jgi:hypothetical protein
MIEKIIAWVAGAKAAALWVKIRGFLAGSRTYLVGGVMSLQGLSGMIADLVTYDNVAQVLSFVRALGENPDWKMLLAGAAIMFGRNALDRIASSAPAGDGPK